MNAGHWAHVGEQHGAVEDVAVKPSPASASGRSRYSRAPAAACACDALGRACRPRRSRSGPRDRGCRRRGPPTRKAAAAVERRRRNVRRRGGLGAAPALLMSRIPVAIADASSLRPSLAVVSPPLHCRRRPRGRTCGHSRPSCRSRSGTSRRPCICLMRPTTPARRGSGRCASSLGSARIGRGSPGLTIAVRRSLSIVTSIQPCAPSGSWIRRQFRIS